MLAAKTQEYTLTDLANSKNESVYVLNTTSKTTGKPSAVAFTVTHTGGELSSILILSTWIPQDLSLQANKTSVLNSPGFRSSLKHGFIRLVNPEKAENILNDPEAQEESARIRSKLSRANNALPEDLRTPPLPDEIANSDVPDGVSLQLVDLCMLDDMDPKEVYARVRNMSESFSLQEVRYLKSKLNRKYMLSNMVAFLDQREKELLDN